MWKTPLLLTQLHMAHDNTTIRPHNAVGYRPLAPQTRNGGLSLIRLDLQAPNQSQSHYRPWNVEANAARNFLPKPFLVDAQGVNKSGPAANEPAPEPVAPAPLEADVVPLAAPPEKANTLTPLYLALGALVLAGLAVLLIWRRKAARKKD